RVFSEGDVVPMPGGAAPAADDCTNVGLELHDGGCTVPADSQYAVFANISASPRARQRATCSPFDLMLTFFNPVPPLRSRSPRSPATTSVICPPSPGARA